MPTERVNEKDEAAVVRAALEDGSRQRWGAASTDTASYFEMSRTALAALDRIITQRDQALAEADALGKQMSAMDTELRRLEAEVERLRAALALAETASQAPTEKP